MASRNPNESLGPKVDMLAIPEVGNSFINYSPAIDKPTMDKTISQDHSNYHGHIFSTAREKNEQPIKLTPISRRYVTQRPGTPDLNTQRFRQATSPPGPAGGGSDEGDNEIFSEQKVTDLAQRLAERLTANIRDLTGEDLQSRSLTSRVMDNLVSAISRLQVESEMFKDELQHVKTAHHTSPEDDYEGDIREGTEFHRSREFAKPVTVYSVRCICMPDTTEVRYLDPPRLFKGDTENCHFRGTIQTLDAEDYIEEYPEVAFVVERSYKCNKEEVRRVLAKEARAGSRGRVLKQDQYLEEPGESGILLSAAAQGGLEAILEAFPCQFPGFQNPPDYLSSEDVISMDNRFEELSKPYSLFYLHGRTLIGALEKVDMSDLMRESVRSLCQWMEVNYRKEWDEADALFTQGKVNEKCLKILFQPGELVVYHDSNENGSLSGAVVPWFPTAGLGYGPRCYSREFNGSLSRSWQTPNITSLDHYPLRFAPDGIKAKLVARGQRFWACRRQKLVCYNEHSADSVFQAEKRFMIDYDMYKRLHPGNDLFQIHRNIDQASPELMGIEEPPEDFLYCLPSAIHGFDFTTKTWTTLQVDRVTDVTWNKRAFSQLVAPPETKELIQAVVSAHGERKNMGLDIIEGKGQGLLVLLHGGPGTGKTLTAESIAEEQERPLYRVTCGDIGTEPKDVERYLGDVLEIGRAWGCVVLLDEADVFLEERSFSDQKRNAIISIFLRILEYYDGILILTTNRIGSFDEAFKSRIQLALGYPPLNEEDRLKIWSNFIQMLPRTKDRVDMEDLQMNLPKLALVEINGREIRNIITMARHLAKFRGQMLRYKHMRDAVESAQKFSKYLSNVKGVSDDDWARADKLR